MTSSQPRSLDRVIRNLFLLSALVATALVPATADTGIRLDLEIEAVGRNTALVNAPDDSDRMFIVQQTGEILIAEGGEILETPFLDISAQVACCSSEQGLTSLAFHPDYETNGRFFIGYVATDLRTVVSRFRVSADPNRAVAGSQREILSWEKRDLNHHGGILAFGPDGYLYIANGEGGARGEAANLETFPGTLLRIDVDRGSTYRVPSDNPFVGMPDVLPEIWAYGVRNPWRLTFDRETGDIFFGDVGASTFEEINFVPADSPGGLNFGWPVKEGTNCLRSAEECADESLLDPIVAYRHDESNPECNSVTGGYFYRGTTATTLTSMYLYGDFCTGQIWGARRNSADRWIPNLLIDTGLNISSFGESVDGELYVADYPGDVYRVVGQPLFADKFESGNTAEWSARRGGLEVVSPGLRKSAHALEVPVGGKAKRFVRSNDPTAETTFRLEFDLNVNRVAIGDQALEILRLGRGTGHIRLTLEQDGNKYWLNLRARRADGSYHLIGRTRVPKGRTTKIGLDWLQASNSDAADGEVLLFKKGKFRTGATDLANGSRTVQSVTVGLPAGGSSTASGAFLVDNYTSSP